MNRSLWTRVAFAALLCLATLAIGCTRTVYVIRQPDGSLTEAPPPTPEEPTSELVTTLEVDPNDPVDLPDDIVVVDVTTSNDYLLSDAGGPLYLQVTVAAKDLVLPDRAPLNLALVIDRSGSMSGQKIKEVKNAASWLVEHLPDGDTITLVTYSTDVSVSSPLKLDSDSREKLLKSIRQISTGGGTNISGGLDAGVLALSEASASRQALHRVILLSDGNANEGVTELRELGRIASRIREEGTTISSMGVGLDYDEELMEEISVKGGGNYYFIADDAAVAAIFEAELEVLEATVVRDAELVLELPEDVVIDEVYGYDFEQEGNSVKVHVNHVSAGQERRVLMAMAPPKRGTGAKVVARGEVRYRNEIKGTETQQEIPEITVNYTADAKRVADGMNLEVIEKLETIRNAEVQREVFARLDHGDTEGAKVLIAERKRQAETINETIQSDDLELQLQSLDSLEDDVEAVPASAQEQEVYRSSKKYKKSKKKSREKAQSMMLY